VSLDTTRPPPHPDCNILGLRVAITNYNEATQFVVDSANEYRQGYVCAANVHMVMLAHDEADFQRVVNSSLLVTPDGMPLKWFINMRGGKLSDRVYGPTLALKICEAAENYGLAIGFYGGRPESLAHLLDGIRTAFPAVNIAYSHAPPFRPLTEEEDAEVIAAINSAGVRILFTGLGCPKQERWMAEHAHNINSIMIGVGAFFDFYSGKVKQAPLWLQRFGLEWLFRLCMEPRRLFWRYAYYNPRFLVLAVLQLLRLKRFN
jgi:N-acetylglucosaminyldiphosphoundecaprenol N-acetyl-beta-D-mannosaminyltransferase